MPINNRSPLVDVYRMMLILYIALFHYTVTYNLNNPEIQIIYPFEFKRGYIGVPLFFMMSGFYMSKVFGSLGGADSYLKYCARRYYRLWVPYVISCIIVYSFLEVFPLFYGHIDLKLLLLNLVLFVHPGIRYVDGAHWFLGMLMIMQIIIGSLLLIKDKGYRNMVLLIICLTVGICQWLSKFSSISISNTYTSSLFSILLGIQFYKVLREKDLPYIGPLLINVIYVACSSFYYLGGLILFLVLSSVRTCRCDNICISSLGELSICWYLVHSRIGCAIQYHFVPHGDTSGIWVLLPIIVTLLVAFIVYLLTYQVKNVLDEKFETILSKLSKKYFN